MSEENKWAGRICDLFHDTYFEQGGLEVSLRSVGGGQGSSTAILIRNKNEEGMQVKFDWYNIPNRRDKKVYDLKPGQQKRFVVPSQRRVTILWRPVQ